MRDGICYNVVAVVTEFDTVWSASLPSNISAQGAELIALKHVCIIAKDKKATIHTYFRYFIWNLSFNGYVMASERIYNLR